MCKDIEILKEVKDVFDKNGVTFWLDCGSLLGAVRDGKIISWDHDFDLGLRYDEIDKINKSIDILKEKGFKVYYSDFIDNIDEKVPYGLFKDGCPIGLFVFPLDYDFCGYEMLMPIHKPGKLMDYMIWVISLRNPELKVSHGSAVPLSITKVLTKFCSVLPEKTREKMVDVFSIVYKKIDSYHFIFLIPSDFYKKLDTIKYYGMDIKVPSPKEDYLEYRYGEDWRTPQKNFKSHALVGMYRYGKKIKTEDFVWRY